MSEPTCSICGKEIEAEDSTFDVPKLPARYEFEELTGPVHRLCLLHYERADELRSALARSLAGAEHDPPSRILAAVDGSIFRVFHAEKSEHTIWNLADFVEFTLLDETVQTILDEGMGTGTRLYAGPTRELQVGEEGMLYLASPSSSAPMPSLPRTKLKRLLSEQRGVDSADPVVRLKAVRGRIPSHRPVVGWMETGGAEPLPVLLRPLSSIGGNRALGVLTAVDPTEVRLDTEPGTPFSLRVDDDTELLAVVIEPEPEDVAPGDDAGKRDREVRPGVSLRV